MARPRGRGCPCTGLGAAPADDAPIVHSDVGRDAGENGPSLSLDPPALLRHRGSAPTRLRHGFDSTTLRIVIHAMLVGGDKDRPRQRAGVRDRISWGAVAISVTSLGERVKRLSDGLEGLD